jgi:DNA-binding NarL/FixJ family response regulator
VVIAEDSVLVQENIRKVISSNCEVVATVEDGQAALDAVSEHLPEVLLLDVSLPTVNGFTIVEKLRQGNSTSKIIFVTAHNDHQYAKRAFEIGANGYVLKGRMWTELPAAIQEVVMGGSYRSPLLR